MPLLEGKKNIKRNIEELVGSGYPAKQAEAIAYSKVEDEESTVFKMETHQNEDENGFLEIKNTNLSKVGVFEYLGRSIDDGNSFFANGQRMNLNPDQIYYIYRPQEELNNQECIESFEMKPFINEHPNLLLGKDGIPAENKGIEGAVKNIHFENGYLKGDIYVYSDRSIEDIKSGKRDISVGYRCNYESINGIYNGIKYDMIQKDIRGNHIALVEEGRCGSDVAIFDHKSISKKVFMFDSAELKMPEEIKEKMKDEEMEDEEMKDEEMKDEEMKDEEEPTEKKSELAEIKEALEVIAKKLEECLQKEGKEGEEVEEESLLDNKDEEVTVSDEEMKDEEMKKEGSRSMDQKIKILQKEMSHLKKKRAFDMSDYVKQVNKKNELVQRLSYHIGSFDHSDKTLDQVCDYALKKLGISSVPKKETLVEAYLKGARSVVYSMDSRKAISNDKSALDFLKS